MNERKNLDKLFQEKFENFNAVPPQESWNNIEMELQKKKEKRRVIPFWWKLSGVAAILLVGFSVINTVIDTKTNTKNETVVDKKNNSKSNSDSKKDLNSIESEIVTTSEEKNETSNSSNSQNNKNLNSKSIITNNQNQIVLSNVSSKEEEQENYLNSNKNTIVKNQTKKQQIPNQKNNKLEFVNNKNTPLVKSSEKQNLPNNNNKTENTNQLNLNTENNIVNDKIAMKNHENIATKGEINTKTDSTTIAIVETNALEELQNEKEKNAPKEPKLNRWQVTPNLAPIYFSSLSNGSPLDQKLEANTKDYKTNYSYGLAVNYALNKKIKLRTGINAFAVNYDTQGIAFFQHSNAKMMKNINPTVQGSYIQIEPLSNVTTSFDKIAPEKFEGTLNQKMGYIEMPLELSYKILDKKFGIELLGGLSTLFLKENEILLEADGMNMKIGEATNLRQLHFSTNLGLGIKYGIFKRIEARVEPVFKYQINTFTTDSGNFKPYVFGVYSGISYTF